MSRQTITIQAPVEEVYAVLCDPMAYDDWVVGTAVLGADGRWPDPGSSLRYEVGFGPMRLRDRTVVLDADEPRRLELRALARPLPPADITIELAPDERFTRVTLDERPANRVLDALMGPVGHLAVSLRNRWALGRLKRVVEAAR